MFLAKKWGILIKKEAESLVCTGLKIPRDYNRMQEEKKITQAYRVRSRNIHIMATDFEYEQIINKMKASGKTSLREFLIDAAINGYLIKVDYSDMRNLAYEINKIGININQIAHKVNSKDAVSKTDMNEIKDKIDIIWNLIKAKFYQMP